MWHSTQKQFHLQLSENVTRLTYPTGNGARPYRVPCCGSIERRFLAARSDDFRTAAVLRHVSWRVPQDVLHLS